MAPRRSRRRWLWLLLPLAALAAFFVLRALLQPERVTAFLLRQAEQATGLTLTLEQPADIGIWPDLHLELIGLRASAPGAVTPLLRAERVEVALTWSALRAETLQLQRLTLIEPVLDVPALQVWLARDADTGPPAPLRLPQFDAAFAVEDGSVVGDGWEVQQLSLALPALRNGTPTTLTASGSIATASDVHGFDIVLDTAPTLDQFDLALAPLTLQLGTTLLGDERPTLAGELHFTVPDALRFGLATQLAAWPAGWPALPFADAGTTATSPDPGVGPDDGRVEVRVDFTGTTVLQGDIDLHIARGGDSIDATFALGDVSAWLASSDADPLPPLRGTARTPRLTFDGIEATGVTLRIDEDAPAADADAKP